MDISSLVSKVFKIVSCELANVLEKTWPWEIIGQTEVGLGAPAAGQQWTGWPDL